MSRWSRAARALTLPAGSRVLDLGCAFGFGTKQLVPRYKTCGHDLSLSYIERAKRSVPGATFTHGPADLLPYPNGYFDGVLLLDVLEHVPDDAAVIDEIYRVLRSDGQLILSVPNQGLLARWDSLNVYQHLFGDSAPPPTDDPSWTASPEHRHYSIAQLYRLTAGRFVMEDGHYTGLGIAEPVNLLLLVLFRRLIPAPRLYALLQYAYFGVYLLEDYLPAGRWGYHFMMRLRRI